MTVPAVPPEASLSVVVHIHDWSTTVYVGEGRQSFAWLAHLASQLYASHCHTTRAATRHSHSLTPLVPLNLTDGDDNHHLPAWPLYEHVAHLQHFYVTLHNSAKPLPPPSQLPLFHHLDTASPAHSQPLSLHFDMNRIPTYRASSSREIDPPCLVTSLTAWRLPIPMRLGKSGVYRVTLHAPLHATVCFVFLVSGKVVLSEEYATGKDQYGQRLHVVTATPPPPSYPPIASPFPPPATLLLPPVDPQLPAADWKRPFASRVSNASFDPAVLVTEQDERDDEVVQPLAVTGHFQPGLPSLLSALSFVTMSAHKESTVAAVQSPLQLRVLDADFAHMHLSDVLDTADKAASMKEALCKHHLLLRAVYASYNTQPLPSTRGLTRCEWLAFCRICRIPDKRVTVQRLNRIFSVALKEDVATLDDDAAGATGASGVQAFGARSQFGANSSLFAPNACLSVSAFFSCLIRTAALKFKQLSASPHAALDSLLSRHVVPYASLYHLPSSHLRDTHHRQVSSVSSQSTQEREREKERSKEKLLYAALLDGAVQSTLQRHEVELYSLYHHIHAQPQLSSGAASSGSHPKPSHALALTEAEEVEGLGVDPLLVSSVGLEQMRAALAGRRWWSGGDSELLVECWQDESMDEKQSEKEKAIELEKAAERETAAGSKDERPVCLYRQSYAEWLLFVCKLADRWRLRRLGSEQQRADKAAAEADKLSATADGAQSARGGEEKEQLQPGVQGADDDERRRDEEEQAGKAAEKERLDEQLHHRALPQHLAAFLQQLFPSAEERARIQAEVEREEREKAEKEEAARAALAAAEKAEKAAKAKAKKTDAAADSKDAGKAGDKAVAAKKK